VAQVLIAYSLGMFVYLGRDVLVRVFYALGDGDTPFRISMVNIGINALMCFVFVRFLNLGAPGLVLATVSVNIFSTIALLWILNKRLNGLQLQTWIAPMVGLTVASIFAGGASWGVLFGIQRLAGKQGFIGLLLELSLAGSMGLVVFGLITARLKVPEFDLFIGRLKRRLPAFLKR
jgi:putative peptidoglycan lipid II flippase